MKDFGVRLVSAAAVVSAVSALAACGSNDALSESGDATSELEPVTVTITATEDPGAAGVPQNGDAAGATGAASPAQPSGQQGRPLAPGEIDLVGTVVKRSGTELAAQEPYPIEEDPRNVYYLLELDQPKEVTAIQGGQQTTKTNTVVRLGSTQFFDSGQYDNAGRWPGLVGKRVRIIAAANSVGYASDVSLPLSSLGVGEPAEVIVLD